MPAGSPSSEILRSPERVVLGLSSRRTVRPSASTSRSCVAETPESESCTSPTVGLGLRVTGSAASSRSRMPARLLAVVSCQMAKKVQLRST